MTVDADGLATDLKRCHLVVQDGDIWIELPDGGMSVQMTKGKAWIDPDAPRAESATKHYVVMLRRGTSGLPVTPTPIAVFEDLDAAGEWVVKCIKRQAAQNEHYSGERPTMYIETVENPQ